MNTIQSIADQFLDAVKHSGLEPETYKRVKESVDTYDREHIDRIDVPTIIQSTKWGSMSTMSYYRFVNDPWSALSFFTQVPNSVWFLVNPGMEVSTVDVVSAEDAGRIMYEHAKKAGFPRIKDFNNAHGFMVSFEELRGSIPEHMREAFEYRYCDEYTGTWKQPHVEKLREWYERERDTIIGMLRCTDKRVQLKDADNEEHTEWVTVPVTKLGFGFGRFEQVSENATQSTAFFNVSDNSPEFKPDVKWNWHLQDTARWLYAGAIAISYHADMKDPQSRISITSHH